MLVRNIALALVFASAQAACGAAHEKGLPEEAFAMPRDPGEVAASDGDEKAPETTPEERAAHRARRHISPALAASSAPEAGAAAPEVAPLPEAREPELPLVLADGSLSAPVIRAMITTPEPRRRAELLRGLGFAAAEVDPVAASLDAPGEITEANLDGDADREWILHVASGDRGMTRETHFIAWLKHTGAGMKPLAVRVEHVENACCDEHRVSGELRLEVMNVHSTSVADTVIWREQADGAGEKSSVDVLSLERQKPESLFHWEQAGKAAAAHDGVIIADGETAPRRIVVFSSAGKPKKTFSFDAKTFAYR